MKVESARTLYALRCDLHLHECSVRRHTRPAVTVTIRRSVCCTNFVADSDRHSVAPGTTLLAIAVGLGRHRLEIEPERLEFFVRHLLKSGPGHRRR